MSKILTEEKDSFEGSDSSVVPTVPEIQKKLLTLLLPPSGPQYNNRTFSVLYSAPPNYGPFPGPYHFQPPLLSPTVPTGFGASHFQPPLPSPTVSLDFGASEPQLPVSDMPTVPAYVEY